MTYYATSDPDALLRRARDDTEEVGALLNVYRHYIKMISRIQIGERLQGKLDASDVVQEVFLRAANAFPSFRGSSEQELLAWLRRIVASVMANMVRKYAGTQRRNVTLERELGQRLDQTSRVMGDALVADQTTPSEALAKKEQAVILADAMERLSEEYREVIMLRHFEQLSFPEIASRMGRTLDSVKNIWPRALAKLRQHLR